jgi:hypothetical protein
VKALIDNDVLAKGACYGLLLDLAAAVAGAASRCGILGAAQFVVPKIIDRQKMNRDPGGAREVFQAFLAQHDIVEPTLPEQQLAAELESAAQALALNLDAGESQLTAILVTRTIPLLVTGDKRAIIAIERLIDTTLRQHDIAGRIQCLEQAMQRLIAATDINDVRRAICAEPSVDKALTICFSCSSPDVARASIREGLDSYVTDLRANATRVLSASLANDVS